MRADRIRHIKYNVVRHYDAQTTQSCRSSSQTLLGAHLHPGIAAGGVGRVQHGAVGKTTRRLRSVWFRI